MSSPVVVHESLRLQGFGIYIVTGSIAIRVCEMWADCRRLYVNQPQASLHWFLFTEFQA